MRRFLQAIVQNWGLKLLAFCGAVILWTYVMTQPRVDRAFETSVHYASLPEDLELNPDQAETVTVVVRGPGSQLEELGRRLELRVDFDEIYRPGEWTFTVTRKSLGLPAGVELVKSVPSQLRFLLERRVRRAVPVQPRFVGSYQPGYVMDSYKVAPPQLVIIGPESRMQLIDRVTTDPIDLGQVVGNTSFRVMAYVTDPYVRFEDDASVLVTVHMKTRQ